MDKDLTEWHIFCTKLGKTKARLVQFKKQKYKANNILNAEAAQIQSQNASAEAPTPVTNRTAQLSLSSQYGYSDIELGLLG